MTNSTPVDRPDLKRLKELGRVEVAKGYPDIRGWTVKSRDAHLIGKVHDLIVSTAEMRVRYLDVDVSGGGNLLIPIGIAELDRKHDDVLVNELTGAELSSYPRYDRDRGIERTYESLVWRHFSPDRAEAPPEGYDAARYDDGQLAASHQARGLMTAERVAAGTVAGGASSTTGASSTAGANQPQRQEDVTVERHLITDVNRSAEVVITENEIRIPLMAEWADGRRMPREEIVVRKRMVDGGTTGPSA